MTAKRMMMNKKLTIFSAILGIILLSMSTLENIKKEDIIKSYPDFIHISSATYDNEYISVDMSVDSIKGEHFLATFVNENWAILNYLLKNHSMIWKDESKEYEQVKSDSVKLRTYFYNSLKKDSIFNLYIIQLTYNSLKKENILITDFKPLDKVEITADSLLNIATRFYYLKYIKNGVPSFTACIGTHGCSKNESIEMLPIIEAFCWQVIRFDENSYYDYRTAKKVIRALKIADMSETEKVEFYRNAMYAEMKNSENLKKAIKREYEKKKDILNFVVIE